MGRCDGIGFPAAAQPISSTLERATSGGSNPNAHAIAASCPGADWGCAYDSYGASSWAARTSSIALCPLRIVPLPFALPQDHLRLPIRTTKRSMVANSSCIQHLWMLWVCPACSFGRQFHGHCPLFTHPGAGLAFNFGDATDVARVAAGRAAVAVAPMFIAVGSTDIAGTVGDVYVPPVAESPDPPATFCGLAAPGCDRTMAAAAMIALPPTAAESRVSCCVRMDYLQHPTGCSHRIGRCLSGEIQKSDWSTSSNSGSFLRRGLFTINRSTTV
jgi:hypothetical protein